MRRSTLYFIVILLLGAGLRLAVVDTHGLDGDEGFSLDMAQRPRGDLIDSFGTDDLDLHPKLYYLLLNVWVDVSGTSETGLRLPNILADLLLGTVLMATARRLYGVRQAGIAGLLWSVNPLLIWVDGQVRMYALLALLAALAWLFLLRAIFTPRRLWWVLFGLAALGAAYTQIMGAVVLASAGAAVALWAVRQRRVGGVIVLGGVGLAYLPYAWVMWSRRGTHPQLSESAPSTVPDFVRQFAGSLLAHGLPATSSWLWIAALAGLGLLAWAIIASRRRAITGTLLLIFGVAALGVAYFVFGADVFRTKYFAYIVPVFVLGAAVGIAALPRRVMQGGVLAGLLALSLVGLTDELAPTARDNFPDAAAFIAAQGDSGDRIIITSNYGASPFRFYYHGSSNVIAPWYAVTDQMPLDDLLTFVSQGYDTIWLVSYLPGAADPDHLLPRWFGERYPLRTEIFPTGVTVRAYDLRPMTDSLPPDATPLDAVYGGRVALRGYRIAQDTVARRDYRLHPPSGWVHVTLYWEVLEPGITFQPRLQVEGDTGAMYGGPLARGTGVTDFYPIDSWQPGQIWRTDTDLNLNPEMPPGSYKIVLRVAGPDGALWPVTDAGPDWLILHRVQVTR